ncbi:MAG TPA: DUF3048 domain-containing protein [Acidimicrobiales bacterium]|nr:DUF3048 domain-containing protein [Acidimicrobiales bacterium]
MFCLLGAALVLAGGCGGEKEKPKAAPTTTGAPATTAVAAPVDPNRAPLTGLPLTAPVNRPALVVKIDNAPKARPQFGLAAADLVIEEGVEGGITRFATVFHSRDAGSVGPVRSARSTDIHLATPLQRPLYAYSGAAPQIEVMLNRSPFVNVGIGRLPGAYRRERSRPQPYNLFSSTQALYAAAPAGATNPKPLFDIAGADARPEGGPVTKVTLAWVGNVRTDVTWTWNGSRWQRVQNGTPHVDAAGGEIAPRNIVVLFVRYEDTGSRDNSGAAVPEAKLVGEGEAFVVRENTIVRGKWRKPSDEAPIQLLDPQGKDVRLLPGQTWVELPAPGMGSAS